MTKNLFLYGAIVLLMFSTVLHADSPSLTKLLDVYYHHDYAHVIKTANQHKTEEKNLFILSLFAEGDYQRASSLIGASHDLAPIDALIRAVPSNSLSKISAALQKLPPNQALRYTLQIADHWIASGDYTLAKKLLESRTEEIGVSVAQRFLICASLQHEALEAEKWAVYILRRNPANTVARKYLNLATPQAWASYFPKTEERLQLLRLALQAENDSLINELDASFHNTKISTDITLGLIKQDISRKRFDKAFERLDSLDSRRTDVLLLKAKLASIQKRREEALACYAQAIRDAVDMPDAYKKLIWEVAWEEYSAGNSEKANQALSLIQWNGKTDLDAKALYWQAHFAGKTNSQNAQQLRKELCQKSPFGYYGARTICQYFPEIQAPLTKRFKSKNLHVDPTIWPAYRKGLGEIKAERLQQQAQTDDAIFSLATLYEKMDQSQKAITLIESKGLGIQSNGTISKEFAKILYPKPHWETVCTAAKKYDIDPYLVLSLMRQESLFNHNALSKSGAIGLMQILPSTGQGIAKKLKIAWPNKQVLFKPETNIQVGVDFLSYLKDRFHNNPAHMLAGYNAGPNATQRWLKDNQTMDEFVAAIPYSETNGYVTKVFKNYWIYKLLYDPQNLPTIFN